MLVASLAGLVPALGCASCHRNAPTTAQATTTCKTGAAALPAADALPRNRTAEPERHVQPAALPGCPDHGTLQEWGLRGALERVLRVATRPDLCGFTSGCVADALREALDHAPGGTLSQPLVLERASRLAARARAASLRLLALDVFGRIGGQGAVAGLVAALRDPSPEVRQRAAEVLGQLGAKAAQVHLLVALDDPDAAVVRAAAIALARLGDAHARRALLAHLHSTRDPELRRVLMRAAAAIATRSGRDATTRPEARARPARYTP